MTPQPGPYTLVNVMDVSFIGYGIYSSPFPFGGWSAGRLEYAGHAEDCLCETQLWHPYGDPDLLATHIIGAQAYWQLWSTSEVQAGAELNGAMKGWYRHELLYQCRGETLVRGEVVLPGHADPDIFARLIQNMQPLPIVQVVVGEGE